jgi:hypothetical protein
MLAVIKQRVSKDRTRTNLEIIELFFRSKFGLMNRLVESKARVWFDLDNVSVAEKMTYFLPTNDSNANIVDISAISRFQIFAIDQRREFVQLGIFINDRVDAEMLLGNGIILEGINTSSF